MKTEAFKLWLAKQGADPAPTSSAKEKGDKNV